MNPNNKVNYRNVLLQESKFLTNLFSILTLPTRSVETEEYLQDDPVNENGEVVARPKLPTHLRGSASRAKSLEELKKRLQAIKSTTKLNYREKLKKKVLKKRIRKKNKQDERNAAQKVLRAEAAANKPIDTDTTVKTEEDTRMEFSKFSFPSEKKVKIVKDPKKILDNLQKQKEKVTKLESAGEVAEAVKIKEKTAWKNALARADGKKVKDDPELLKKSIQKNEQKKRQSKKKWESRKEGVQKTQDDRQKKRLENINKRKEKNASDKKKRAAKKGRIIPGNK